MARPRKGVTAADRIFSLVSVDEVTGCWEWNGYRQPAGHGRVRVDGQKVLVHVWVWEQLVGPVPDGLELDHLCRNPPCCNPEHLEPVTHQVNVLRGNAPAAAHARKTHCPRGHAYDERNTRIYRGSRYCRACKRTTPTISGPDTPSPVPGPVAASTNGSATSTPTENREIA